LSDKGKIMKKLVVLFPLFFFLLPALVQASPPVPFSGKVAIDGVNFHGQAQFTFAIRGQAGQGDWHWRNGATANDAINVNVSNGRYVVLLGGQGMNPLPASLFANHDELYVKVSFDNHDGQGLRHLAPDQRITAVPYALSAETAKTADSVKQGAVTTAQLNEQILKYLKPEITAQPQVQTVYEDSNVFFSVTAAGKYLSYQWKKDGADLIGETNATLTITDANATKHEGNYSVIVSNDFGSVSTNSISVEVILPPPPPPTHKVDLNATVSMDMIWVSAGTFTMGSPASEVNRQTNETEHNVTLTKGFYLGKYEVTQAQYEAVMTGNPEGLNPKPSNWPNNPNRPVEKVSGDDAKIFVNRLNAAEQAAGRLPAGWSYVLPTESQWEYACRAGTTTTYSWGATIASSNTNFLLSGFNQTTDVGQYAANPWGFFDMHGNVWELTADRYQAAYPTGNPVVDPVGPASGSKDVVRGGSWVNDGARLRSAERHVNTPSYRYYTVGFRVGFQKQ
jgi:formylglycine-generating enzyme required for sulfatase activity